MRIPEPPPLTSKHIEERFKLIASGLQNLALLLFGAVLLQPLLNAALAPARWLRIAAVLIAGGAELAAILLLRYIDFTPTSKDKVQ